MDPVELEFWVVVPCGCWEVNPGQSIEQQVLLITEPSSSPLYGLKGRVYPSCNRRRLEDGRTVSCAAAFEMVEGAALGSLKKKISCSPAWPLAHYIVEDGPRSLACFSCSSLLSARIGDMFTMLDQPAFHC